MMGIRVIFIMRSYQYVNTYILITHRRAIYAKLHMQIFFANNYNYVCLH